MNEADNILWEINWDKDFSGSQQIGKLGVWTHSQSARFFDLSVKSLCSLKSTGKSRTWMEEIQHFLSEWTNKVLLFIKTLLNNGQN